MKNYVIILASIFSSCTHQPSNATYKIVSKTGGFLSLNNNSDTLTLGDTLAISFNLTNTIKLDNGNTLNMNSIVKTGFGYNFDKNGIYPAFDPTPKVVELLQSSLPYDGMFSFNALLKQLVGSTIHYVPQDTGTYVLTTNRNQYIVCSTNENSDQYQINLFPDFNVPNIHKYLLDPYPLTKAGKEISKSEEAVPYYCFYVKPK
jgi:hypothetical protein